MINDIKRVLSSTIGVLVMITIYSAVGAQSVTPITSPCGFVESEEFMDRVDLLKQSVSSKTTGISDTIPLSVHLVANDFGYGRQSIPKLLDNICNLNTQYLPVNFHFWIQWPIDNIDNTLYFDHTYSDGYAMMNNHNVNGTLNLYWVGSPAGNCGYYAGGPDAIALSTSCTNGNNTTIAHELGHLFNLPHPFRGWEGGNTPSNPEKVTRGAGANCNSAGDRFCDTEADFISNRWNCPYTGNKVDVNGDLYKPDSTLYMSYSSDKCQDKFSPQQIQTMRADRDLRWPTMNQSYPVHVANFANPTITSFTDTMYNDRRLTWTAVPGADAYYVQMSLRLLPNIYRFDTLVYNTNSIVIPSKYMSNSKEYLFRIKPMNGNSVCAPFSPDHEAVYYDTPNPNGWIDGISSQDLENISLTANHHDDVLSIQVKSPKNIETKLYITDLLGRNITSSPHNFYQGGDQYQLPLSLGAGVYLLSMDIEGSTKTVKFVVH